MCRFANGLLTAATGNQRNRAATGGGVSVGIAAEQRLLPLFAVGCRDVGGRSSPPSDTTFPQVTGLGILGFRPMSLICHQLLEASLRKRAMGQPLRMRPP